jgi:hypothetical protein
VLFSQVGVVRYYLWDEDSTHHMAM